MCSRAQAIAVCFGRKGVTKQIHTARRYLKRLVCRREAEVRRRNVELARSVISCRVGADAGNVLAGESTDEAATSGHGTAARRSSAPHRGNAVREVEASCADTLWQRTWRGINLHGVMVVHLHGRVERGIKGWEGRGEDSRLRQWTRSRADRGVESDVVVLHRAHARCEIEFRA